MPPGPPDASGSSTRATDRPRDPGPLWPALSALAGAGAFAFAPPGLGWWLVAALAAALAGVAAAWPQLAGRSRVDGAGPAQEADGDAPLNGTAAVALPRQLVPVWKRSLALVREQSERDASQLLESFSNVTSNLDHALGSDAGSPTLDLGVADALVERHRPQIDTLLGTTRLAVRLKDEMLEGVCALAETLEKMVVLTREIQNIGRSTHLLALNASVEATRASSGGGGFAVVAAQVRDLAGQSRQVGQQLTRHVTTMQELVQRLKTSARAHDTDEDELTLQAEENARAVLVALVGSLAEFTRSSRTLRDTSRQVQDDLERIFVGLQGQDRLSQMLEAVSSDMDRFTAWLEGAPDPAGATPARWLERLEASYTMEEQRSSHHDTKVIEREAGVEFF